ncbi:unnamed protein product [Albugo candida]|uniref:ABC transporter domain-containing protein n=1 Tax=Albugo candida TaxID=65357 RepID=A0A024GIE0_9STRA|nr:unnamed protein product [Albugo candida]|eukprot:CCI46520.1 unnamed protein product [Albugo candida]
MSAKLETKKVESNRATLINWQDPHALYERVATKLENALGQPLPQMEVRFQNITITAKMERGKDESGKMPTFGNAAMRVAQKCCRDYRETHEKVILDDVSGVLRPGSMTLVLGQPASGKSTLLKYLSGRFHHKKNVSIRGEVSYNGVANHQLTAVLPQFVSYVSQKDEHFADLTVKETLEFARNLTAWKFPQPLARKLQKITSENAVEALALANAMYQHYPDIVIESYGLQDCKDTKIGSGMLRGVSGGERKRVTSGEMEIGFRNVTFMDEISTGLDSAATLDIIKLQRTLARTFHKTIVIALLQPSPQVFELFDHVILLNQGHVMYQGPREKAVHYFEKMGFVRPCDRDPADFLLDIGTKEQVRYQTSNFRSVSLPRTPEEFAHAFRRSRYYARIQQQVCEPMNPTLRRDVEEYMEPSKPFTVTYFRELCVLTKRSWLLTIRNPALVQGRTLMIIISGLLYGTIFYQIEPTNIQVMLGVFFASTMFIALGQVAMIPTFIEARDIFYKQRDANFHRTSCFIFANTLLQMIPIVLRGLVFGTMVYWFCGLVPAFSSFALFILVMIVVGLVFNAWFFFISMISFDIHIAHPFAMLSILFFALYAGFIVVRSQIPNYLLWLYWNNPISWCIRMLGINQYRNSTLDVCVYEGINYCKRFGTTFGKYYLKLFDVYTDQKWILYGFIYLCAMYVLLTIASIFVLEYQRVDVHDYSSAAMEEIDDEDTTHEARKDSYTTLQTPMDNQEEVRLPIGHEDAAFVPVTLCFKNLYYSVPDPNAPKQDLTLLQGISGYAMPGTMTALMGSSGAGKTTLMDVIAGRKTGGKIQGDIMLNGYPASVLAIRRSTGYCEQMDIHSEASTFREALTFSAFLRQGADVSAAVKYHSVQECLDLLNLNAIADKIIRGSSVEQLKRLTIGVELAARPSVLFLDEPTSGLDARCAKVIMDGVRKVADSGRTIVCTIHQPSYEVFQLFDSLLLLKRGGEMVYFGELGQKCKTLVTYFEAIPGVEKLPLHYNPASWMLECIGAGVCHASDVDFVAYFAQSPERRYLTATLDKDGVGVPSLMVPQLHYTQKRAARAMTQMQWVIGRFFVLYWRTPTYTLTRFVIAIILALVFGLTFLGTDYQTFQQVNSGMGMFFVSTLFLSFIVTDGTMAPTFQERAAFYRERASETYNALWYFIGSSLAEIPYLFMTALMFTAIFFPMVGLTLYWKDWILFFLALFTELLLSVYMGKFIANSLPNLELAMVLNVIWSIASLLTMGFSPPAKSIPSGYRWLYYILPRRYQFNTLAAIAFGQCNTPSDIGCAPLLGGPSVIGNVTVKEFVKDVFDADYDHIGRNFAVCLGATAIFLLLSLVCTRFVNFQKR